MTGTKHQPTSVDLYKISVLKDEVHRMECLDLVTENQEVYVWLKQRIRFLEEGK